jgi:hypothetical protein
MKWFLYVGFTSAPAIIYLIAVLSSSVTATVAFKLFGFIIGPIAHHYLGDKP